MSEKPLISFVVPAYNSDAWLGECLVGLYSQTVKEIEVVVVNDGSTDRTKEFLDNWAAKEKRTKIIHHEKNLGAGVSRNHGMEASSADIIGVCDADDAYVTERAEKILGWFKKNPESELVNFPYVSIGYFMEVLEHQPGEPFDNERFLKTGDVNYFCNPSAAYKKEAVMKMGGYPNEKDNMTDDYQFLKKWVGEGHKVDFCPNEPICLHRTLPNSMMSRFRGWKPEWVTKS